MRKPPRRPDSPKRSSDNDKRRLRPNTDLDILARLASNAVYQGISKHKREPQRFGLAPFSGKRGDESQCDEHGGFNPADMPTIPLMIRRGILAGLIGDGGDQNVPSIIWAVSDMGRIFEARITNVVQFDYHGYPVRQSEAITESIYRRFADWAKIHGNAIDRQAAANCQAFYGFRE